MKELSSFEIICHNALKSLSKLTCIVMKATIVHSNFILSNSQMCFCQCLQNIGILIKSRCCDCSSFYKSNIILVRCYTQKLKYRHTLCGHFSFTGILLLWNNILLLVWHLGNGLQIFGDRNGLFVFIDIHKLHYIYAYFL